MFHSRQSLVGVLCVAVSATCFGAMAIFARSAYAGHADIIAVLFLRFLIASLAMSTFVWASKRNWPRGRNLLVLSAMGGVGYVCQSYAFFSALQYASAGLVALLLYLYPFLVTVLNSAVNRTRLRGFRLAMVLLALMGTALTLGGDMTGQPRGIMLGIAAAAIYSIYIVVGARVLEREDPFASATIVMLSAAAVFAAVTIASEPRFPQTADAWYAVIAIALLSTAIAMGGFFVGVRLLGAPDAAAISTLEPVVTFVLAAIFLGEEVSIQQLLGGAVILSAVIMLTRYREQSTTKLSEISARRAE